MLHGSKVLTVLALALVLPGCGARQEQADEAAAPSADATPDVAKPPAVFAQCMSCHTVEAGKNMIGPSLHGVIGRKAASVPGFAYSPALKASGLTWDEATLDKWLTNPMQDVPGTKMVFAGLPDPAKRKQLIDWLKEQK